MAIHRFESWEEKVNFLRKENPHATIKMEYTVWYQSTYGHASQFRVDEEVIVSYLNLEFNQVMVMKLDGEIESALVPLDFVCISEGDIQKQVWF